MVAYLCDSSSWEVEAGGSELKVHQPWWCTPLILAPSRWISESEVSLVYIMRPCLKNVFFFFKENLTCITICLLVYLCPPCMLDARGCQEKALYSLKLVSQRLWMTMWVLRTEPGFSPRTSSTLTLWAISLVPYLSIYFETRSHYS